MHLNCLVKSMLLLHRVAGECVRRKEARLFEVIVTSNSAMLRCVELNRCMDICSGSCASRRASQARAAFHLISEGHTCCHCHQDGAHHHWLHRCAFIKFTSTDAIADHLPFSTASTANNARAVMPMAMPCMLVPPTTAPQFWQSAFTKACAQHILH